HRRAGYLLQGYQMQGSENTLYLAAGQRLALATLSEEGIKALTLNGEWQAGEFSASNMVNRNTGCW
ncbi:cytochrome C TorY domain protein, partial [Shigella flexneri]|nr:cytochrome C TorY domain protein [Shigella flexneri]